MKFKINIDTAIEAMIKNLDEHKVELKDATTGWTVQAIAALERLRDAIDRKGLDASHNELWQLLANRPVDNRKHYSKFLGALERAKQDGQAHVEVDEDDYDRIFNDNWEWRIQSKISNARYTPQ